MTQISRRTLITGAAAAATTGAASFMGSAFAQSAGRPITLVVPTPAGGTTDISARLLAEPLGKILGVPVVVDNRGGANGNIAGQMVARAPADGNTFLVQYSGYQSITPLLQPVAGFDPGQDLKAIAHLIDAPQLMVVRNNFPANTFAEFIKYAKANPGKVNYASSGNGSLQHVTTELLKDLTKTYMTHIPYRGTGQALTDLLSGTVDFTITTPPPLLPHIRSGKLRALMVTGRTRLAAQPDVPTATEQGVPLVASSWFAVYGPNGIPNETLARVSAAIKQVVESEQFRKRAEEQGAKAVFLNGTELAKLASDERGMWGRIIKVSGIKAD
ncbi:Bug family tripartite tricarboxylate transporter substrate binding protein [Polaromonas sp. UC242_47]|uniref:Bug family tripartite tricarboxylate transporter substrate binding protein n=1 Tax=Polaromonas sp. UC242_47 TaxID=3374626 RepID=UPI0037B7836C